MVTHFLSAEKRDFYNEKGFLVIKQLFDTKTLDNLRRRFTEICKGNLKKPVTVIKEHSLINKTTHPEDYINKIQDLLHDEVFMTYSEDPRLLHIVSQFLGEDLTAVNSMMINKPPGTSRHPPHQDSYYIPVRPAHILVSWTAIDPATIENGCLFCIPGTHKMPLLKHGVFPDSKTFFHVLSEEEKNAPEENRMYFEMNPGDTVLFHPQLIHGSGANLSKSHRKSMTVHYMSSSCQFVDVTGTDQEPLIEEYHTKVRKTGDPGTYHDFLRMRSKVLQIVRT